MINALRRAFQCHRNRHKPIRLSVLWDGLHYIGKCKICGEDIRRISRRRWRRDLLGKQSE